MGLRVLLLTRYGRTGASRRLRFLQYLAGLDEYEIDVHPAPFLDDVYLKELYDGRRPSLGVSLPSIPNACTIWSRRESSTSYGSKRRSCLGCRGG
jgi:hypothetical protein